MTKTKTKTKRAPSDRLAVWKGNCKNPRLVEVELDDAELATVRVRDNNLYCQGMIFSVREVNGTFYEQKPPRQRGKV